MRRGHLRLAKKRKQVYESFETSCRSNFVALYWDMLDSKAWQELTAHDIQLYIYMRRKYQRKVTNGQIWDSNKDNISIPRNEYLKLMHQQTFEKSIDHLIDLGFIKLIENRYAVRKCNIYGFNDMWAKYGTDEFYIKPEWRRTFKQQKKAREKKQERAMAKKQL
jgi:hypothetical protein